MVKMIAEVYKHNNQVRVSAAPPRMLLVYADPQTQLEIHESLNAQPPAELQSAVIALNWLEAVPFIDELKAMIPDAKNNSPYLSTDIGSNSIRVRGTAEQIKEVRRIIGAMDDATAPNLGVINLDKRGAATMAQAIEMLLPQFRR